MRMIVYAHVFTSSQTLVSQLEQLGGAQSNRPQTTASLKAIEPSDTLVITRLERFTRLTRDLLDIVHTVEATAARLLYQPCPKTLVFGTVWKSPAFSRQKPRSKPSCCLSSHLLERP